MMEVMEDREVWGLNIELLACNPHGIAGDNKMKVLHVFATKKITSNVKFLRNETKIFLPKNLIIFSTV